MHRILGKECSNSFFFFSTFREKTFFFFDISFFGSKKRIDPASQTYADRSSALILQGPISFEKKKITVGHVFIELHRPKITVVFKFLTFLWFQRPNADEVVTNLCRQKWRDYKNKKGCITAMQAVQYRLYCYDTVVYCIQTCEKK